MTQDQYMNLVRAVMNAVGGAAVASGIASGSTMGIIIGIMPNIAAIAWGIFVHSPKQVVKAAEIVQKEGLA